MNARIAWIAVLLLPVTARAQTGLLDRRSATFWSRDGYHTFLALGVGRPLADGARGRRQVRQTVESLLTTGAICQVTKWLTHRTRPDGSTPDSFPSGHATAAFAVAASQVRYRRRETLLWYAGAAPSPTRESLLGGIIPKTFSSGRLWGFRGRASPSPASSK